MGTPKSANAVFLIQRDAQKHWRDRRVAALKFIDYIQEHRSLFFYDGSEIKITNTLKSLTATFHYIVHHLR